MEREVCEGVSKKSEVMLQFLQKKAGLVWVCLPLRALYRNHYCMADAVSKEMLKSALVELAESDREFFISLLSETLASFAATPEGASSAKSQKSTSGKLLPTKVIPPYHKYAAALRQKYAIDKSALPMLRELFADAPNAESIIATLSK